jgi:hypothetical protein
MDFGCYPDDRLLPLPNTELYVCIVKMELLAIEASAT